MPKHVVTPDAALIRLEELCSRSEQCSFEVLTKMRTWGLPAAEAQKILHKLRSDKYVDDSRYARAYTRDKFLFSRWGRRKIAAGLMAKRIEASLIDEAIDSEIADNRQYLANIIAILRTKARSMDTPLSYDDCRKLLRFGISRGYETALVLSAIRRLKANLSDPDEDLLVD